MLELNFQFRFLRTTRTRTRTSRFSRRRKFYHSSRRSRWLKSVPLLSCKNNENTMENFCRGVELGQKTGEEIRVHAMREEDRTYSERRRGLSLSSLLFLSLTYFSSLAGGLTRSRQWPTSFGTTWRIRTSSPRSKSKLVIAKKKRNQVEMRD